jgi:hypothetical protein
MHARNKKAKTKTCRANARKIALTISWTQGRREGTNRAISLRLPRARYGGIFSANVDDSRPSFGHMAQWIAMGLSQLMMAY